MRCLTYLHQFLENPSYLLLLLMARFGRRLNERPPSSPPRRCNFNPLGAYAVGPSPEPTQSHDHSQFSPKSHHEVPNSSTEIRGDEIIEAASLRSRPLGPSFSVVVCQTGSSLWGRCHPNGAGEGVPASLLLALGCPWRLFGGILGAFCRIAILAEHAGNRGEGHRGG